jgi:hypothetical protein
MGILKWFTRRSQPQLVRLPAGSFTLDKEGRLMTSTLPQSFPQETLLEIGRRVLATFNHAHQAQMPLAELVVHYPTLKVLARELRGGAIVFLMPVR